MSQKIEWGLSMTLVNQQFQEGNKVGYRWRGAMAHMNSSSFLVGLFFSHCHKEVLHPVRQGGGGMNLGLVYACKSINGGED